MNTLVHTLLTRFSQVVGGTGFIISSWLFMLETQSKWYVPAPKQLGWQIGFWNLVGALGFTLCGALGFASTNSACEIALTWATFIGSWAFLVCVLHTMYSLTSFRHSYVHFLHYFSFPHIILF